MLGLAMWVLWCFDESCPPDVILSSPCNAEYVLPEPWSEHDSHRNLNIDYAIANKLTPFISMQNHYNLLYREEEHEMFPMLKVAFVSLSVWFLVILN